MGDGPLALFGSRTTADATFESETGQQPICRARSFLHMQYRAIEYHVVQTANPTGWKWTVQLDGRRTRTSTGFKRTHAIALAQQAIDQALPAVFSTTETA
jgi:hypothetical protein